MFEFREIVHRIAVGSYGWHVGVHADAMFRVIGGERRRYSSTPVTALCKILVVIKPKHDGIPSVGDLFNVPAMMFGLG